MLKKAIDQLTAKFDKIKAMRSAEQHVAQGKIRAAISEYKAVVQNDPKDFGTMNMLGDLYTKISDKKKAVECYMVVADHYHKQGFSQKAIAVYKKISKLEPDSVAVSAKLAELYQTKGSVSEARSHYTTLADHYRQTGKISEALAMWKQIAMLDPNDIEVYPKLAESYLHESQPEEAADAYAEAALRFARAGHHDKAAHNFGQALAIAPSNRKALEGLVKVHRELGTPEIAESTLESFLEKDQHNKEIISLLVDCALAAGNTEKAEKSLVRLVELEPSLHPKFVDLADVYLVSGDNASAVRALSLCIEKLLLAGRGAEIKHRVDQVLEKEPENLGAIRLLVRYYSWERQKKELKTSLEQMAMIAKTAASVDDERYALSQLVIIVPQQAGYGERLREINEKYGFDENPYDDTVLQRQFDDVDYETSFEITSSGQSAPVGDAAPPKKKSRKKTEEAVVIERNGVGEETRGGNEPNSQADTGSVSEPVDGSSLTRENDIEKELESIRFYVENGYASLAASALEDLRTTHGSLPEFDEIEKTFANAAVSDESEPAASIESAVSSNGNGHKSHEMHDMRSELGLDDEADADVSDDYDTHYHMAVAYQEMGLMEEAIKEFQDAINLVKPNDSKQRFFQCANLLGHCFMQNQMAKLALKWYERALETPNLDANEKKAMWYEIAIAYEADGDTQNAAKYFEQVYSEDVDFRDIAERMKNLMITA